MQWKRSEDIPLPGQLGTFLVTQMPPASPRLALKVEAPMAIMSLRSNSIKLERRRVTVG